MIRTAISLGGCLLVLAACTVAPHASNSATESSSSSGADGQSVTGHIVSTIGTTTSTTFTTSTTSTESEPTDGQNFVMPPDLPSDCDLRNQNCPAGQKCVSYAGEFEQIWTGAKCVDIVADPGQPGDLCTISGYWLSGEDTCDKGSTCWFAFDLSGRCLANCTGSIEQPICPEPGQVCSFISDNTYTPLLCLPECNPLTQDCPGGDLCLPFDYPVRIFTCYPPAEGAVLGPLEPCDPFEPLDECGPGLFCSEGSAAKECDPRGRCCLSFCDLTDPVCPGQDQECFPWYAPEEVPPEYTTVGGCSLPG